MNLIQQRHARGEVVTGLLHVDAEASDLHGHLATVPVPVDSLDADERNPGAALPDTIIAPLPCWPSGLRPAEQEERRVGKEWVVSCWWRCVRYRCKQNYNTQ